MSKEFKSLHSLEVEIEKLRSVLKKDFLMIFRGQSDSSWKLETALDRYSKNNQYSVNDYDEILKKISSTVEVFSEKKWSMSDLSKEDSMINGFKVPPSLEFMVYARHYGFPTPILDWSKSLYVALFFAFQQASEDESVAIYICVDRQVICDGDETLSQIYVIDKNLATDKRHYIQQAVYTCCVEGSENGAVYSKHEDVYERDAHEGRTFKLKAILPGSLKVEILNKLNEMNINEFTLYGDEASLFEMLAHKEIRNQFRNG